MLILKGQEQKNKCKKCFKYKSINELIVIFGNEKKWYFVKMDVFFFMVVYSGVVF